jgi:putative oxidoreductase
MEAIMTTTTTTTWHDYGLLVLRVGVGLVFVAHGLQKAFVFGPEGLAGSFGSIGIPLPYLNAVFITGLEIAAGLALVAGALTRVFAVLLGATMVVAIATVHLANGFFMETNGYEFALLLLFANAALTLTGAGVRSVDARLFGRRDGEAPAPRHAIRDAA